MHPSDIAAFPMTLRGPRILFAASEAFPLAKTGGLGDVGGALPAALAAQGADVRIMLPGYPQALDLLEGKRAIAPLQLPLGGGNLIAGRMPGTGLSVYLYDAPRLFRRSGSLYQDPSGEGWRDNDTRFAAFCHAVAAVGRGLADPAWRPEIIHANDWHTGLAPAILARDHNRCATLFTIHNLAFQGNFPWDVAHELFLPEGLLNAEGLEFFGQVSFLKAAIRYSDRLTTVSPTYAREIMTPKYGCGMEGLLSIREQDLVGILNGVDYKIWDPAVDAAIASRYTADDISGKGACKAAVQAEFRLDRSDAPLIIFVNRVTHQKMADIVLEALPALLQGGAQFVLHGQGDKSLERAFEAAARGNRGRMAVRIGYDEGLTRRLTAAADLSLTASRFEPCGLTTMYAMRYGAIPVTRRTGGLADTVVDADRPAFGEEHGTGFVFDAETPEAVATCVRRAAERFQGRHWRGLQRSAMRRDFGWESPARRYLDLYRELIADRRDMPADSSPRRAA